MGLLVVAVLAPIERDASVTMLAKNLRNDVGPREARVIVHRTPNYCPQCGKELIIYGGRLQEVAGFYDHIDPEVRCAGGCKTYRFTMGTEGKGEEGREFRRIDGDHDERFGHVVGYCDLHSTRMVPTKDLILMNRDGEPVPVRQCKCPVGGCDLETCISLLGDE